MNEVLGFNMTFRLDVSPHHTAGAPNQRTFFSLGKSFFRRKSLVSDLTHYILLLLPKKKVMIIRKDPSRIQRMGIIAILVAIGCGDQVVSIFLQHIHR